MASLFGAAFGGALKGLGEGLAADVRHKREETLRQLELDHAERISLRSDQLQRDLSVAQIASNEKLTKAQQDTQMALGRLSTGSAEKIASGSQATTLSVADKEIASRKELTRDEIAARKEQYLAEIGAQKDIAGTNIQAQKDLQAQQVEAAQQLGIKPMQTAAGKQVWVRPDGKKITGPVDDAGNPIDLAITDTDTDDIKNVKYLMTLGVPQAEAIKVLNSKNDNRNLIQAGIFKSIIDGMSTMKNLAAEDFDFANGKSKEITDGIIAGGSPTAPATTTAPAAGSPDATTPAVPSSADSTAPAITIPSTWTPAQLKAQVDAAIAGGVDKAAIRDAIVKAGRDPAEAGL